MTSTSGSATATPHQELAGWAPRIAALAEEADDTHVLFNNCYRDRAQVNAQQLAALLKRRSRQREGLSGGVHLRTGPRRAAGCR